MDHIGIDVHKKESQMCILAEGGELLERRIRTEPRCFAEVLRDRPRARVVIEASTDSEWVARCLEGLGHEVIVADPNFAPYLAWGLSEYAFHRWLYHQPHGILGDGHRLHHEDPLVLIAMPWFLTPTTVFGLWYLGSVMLRLPCFAAGLAGWLAGSVWYGLVHHSHHHWALRTPWLRTLRVSHRIHHHFPEFNFGVTMRLWDSVFGTRYRKRVHVPRVAGGRQP